MKKLLGLFSLSLFFYSTTYACTVIDDAGNTIHLEKPAHRIISLAPHITETLFAIGAGHDVIGVISGSDYPQAAKGLPKVGNYRDIDLELVISSHPDLIIAWSHSFARQLESL